MEVRYSVIINPLSIYPCIPALHYLRNGLLMDDSPPST